MAVTEDKNPLDRFVGRHIVARPFREGEPNRAGVWKNQLSSEAERAEIVAAWLHDNTVRLAVIADTGETGVFNFNEVCFETDDMRRDYETRQKEKDKQLSADDKARNDAEMARIAAERDNNKQAQARR